MVRSRVGLDVVCLGIWLVLSVCSRHPWLRLARSWLSKASYWASWWLEIVGSCRQGFQRSQDILSCLERDSHNWQQDDHYCQEYNCSCMVETRGGVLVVVCLYHDNNEHHYQNRGAGERDPSPDHLDPAEVASRSSQTFCQFVLIIWSLFEKISSPTQ